MVRCGIAAISCTTATPSSRGPFCSKVILFSERSLRRALSNYLDHFHAERNHQGKGNILLFPRLTIGSVKDLCDAASDWAGSCATTIERQPNGSVKRLF